MDYGVVGYNGRLGKEVIDLFDELNHNFVYRKSIEKEEMKKLPQVLIDCSLPDALNENLNFAYNNKIPLVLASTGLTDEQLKEIQKISAHIPIVQSYNFSIGIQVLLKLTNEAKQYLQDWDIEISETHHRFKKDKPSGTAKMIQQLFENEINTTSLRLGNVSGDHTISFGGLGEVLSINHRALSRRTFAEGILKSAEFLLKAKNGLYSFKEVLFGTEKQIDWR